MDKSLTFNKQLNLITTDLIRSFTKMMLDSAPDYFYVVDSSSTGKYHLKNGVSVKLVDHVKSAAQFAYELVQNPIFGLVSDYDKDLVVSATLLHDIVKRGLTETPYTVFDHPRLAGEFFSQVGYPESMSEIANKVSQLIITHHGLWNIDKYGYGEKLPIPKTTGQIVVHISDYLSSRSNVDITYE